MSLENRNLTFGEIPNGNTLGMNHVGLGLSTTFNPRPRDWKAPLGDSGQNSLECWDYTMELEMMNGPSDLQLAAELGKTLLERNKELESTIRELRAHIDDKTQEIEYLSKQTTALREVNDSRLRIYEQLEISIQDLEKTNQRLTAEGGTDKKKIKSLTSIVDQLESRVEELTKALDELKSSQQISQQRHEEDEEQKKDFEIGGISSRKLLTTEEVTLKRSMSYGNTAKCCEEIASECVELQTKVETLQAKLKESLEERRQEARKREDLEIELECATQENAVLREQLMVLKEKENNIKSFEDELASIDDTSSSRICKKCMGVVEETGSNMTMQDFTEDFLDNTDVSYDDIQGDCALVRLKNGGYAWGSQESLASMGQVVNCVESNGTSPHTERSEAPNSLLSELDTQYRILIEKYEALLSARESRDATFDKPTKTPTSPPATLVDSGVDEVSGPMSLVMTSHKDDDGMSNTTGLFCTRRCDTCSCDIRLKERTRPKSSIEDHSEVETSSSGFSEGESRTCSRSTQTDLDETIFTTDALDATTPTPSQNSLLLDFNTSLNPCEKRFQSTPLYKILFHEIFETLKKDIDKDEVKVAVTKSLMNSQILMSKTSNNNNNNEIVVNENDENINPNIGAADKDDTKSQQSDETLRTEDRKPHRPDSLDLDQVSTCSSRSRKRRKHKHRHNAKTDDTTSENTTSTTTTTTTTPTDFTEKQEHADQPIDTTAGTAERNQSYERKSTQPLQKGKCEHKTRRKRQKQASLQNKHLTRLIAQSSVPNPSAKQSNPPPKAANPPPVPPQNLPSVQVAKLIKFERSYAEVLKSRRS